MFKLVIADEGGTKTTVPLVRDEITIGRKEGNTIRLTERNISRTHAQLRRSDSGFVLRDLSSYNGVRVNGQRVDGEIAIAAGDQIKLGDYAMEVESDQPVAALPSIPPPPPVPSVPGAPGAPIAAAPLSPARLVMLAGPTPGADYPLPASGALRMGRGEDLDVPIDHRSVSREHAEVRVSGTGVRVVDLNSANGLRVNGGRSSDGELHDGDVIELGEVALRYVAAGESYVFDPIDGAPYVKKGAGSRQGLALIAVAGAVFAVVGYLVFGGSAPEEITTVTPLPPAPRVSSVVAAAPPPVVADEQSPADQAAAALAACRGAVEGERFAEAIAHATSALRAQPDDVQAADCMAVATSGHAAEQAYVRGKSALRSGDPAGAMAEFARLPSDSPFATKPEISEARGLVETERRAAAAAPVAAAAAVGPVKTRPAVRRAPEPSPDPVVAGTPSGSPFQTASACLARGDNACVIKALTGKARTPQELGLLIETHRSLGNTDKATAAMEQYVKQFPTGPKAATYQRMLERQGQ
jgi:pSer/pThr/pTyr-binding forkhead associated (FHA) protein